MSASLNARTPGYLAVGLNKGRRLRGTTTTTFMWLCGVRSWDALCFKIRPLPFITQNINNTLFALPQGFQKKKGLAHKQSVYKKNSYWNHLGWAASIVVLFAAEVGSLECIQLMKVLVGFRLSGMSWTPALCEPPPVWFWDFLDVNLKHQTTHTFCTTIILPQ